MSTADKISSAAVQDTGPLRDHVVRVHFHLACGFALATGGALAARWLAFDVAPSDIPHRTAFGEFLAGPTGPFWSTVLVLALAYAMRRVVGRSGAVNSVVLYAVFTVILGMSMVAVVGAEAARGVGRALSVACLAFCAMAAYGYLAGRLLSGLASFGFMCLIGLAGCWLMGKAAPYPGSPGTGAAVALVVAFSAYLAYDTQRLRRFSGTGRQGDDASVWGAMSFFSDMLRLPWDFLKALGRINWWQAACEFVGYLIAAIFFGMLGS